MSAAVASVPSDMASSGSTKRRTAKDMMSMPVQKVSAPLFLRKTYTLVEVGDNNIVSWWDNGDTFVVKDTERFSTEVIPEFFKHNNFSSFVRQLNFYGFRKIKNDPLRLRDAELDEESKYWKFGHDFFKRGRLDLLAQIKKAVAPPSEPTEKNLADSLRDEIKELNMQLDAMTRDVDELNQVISHYHYVEETSKMSPIDYSSAKCVSVTPTSSSSIRNDFEPPLKKRVTALSPEYEQNIPVYGETFYGDTESPFTFEGLSKMEDFAPHKLKPARRASRFESMGAMSAMSFNTTDGKMLEAVFDIDQLVNETFEEQFGRQEEAGASSCLQEVNPVPVSEFSMFDKLQYALSAIPEDYQSIFVDCLVGAIQNPEMYKDQMALQETMTRAASHEAFTRLVKAGRSPQDPALCPLIQPILGTYLVSSSSEDLSI